MKKTLLTILAMLICLPIGLLAQDEEKIQIHGFGSWGYGKTDANSYFWSNKEGAWDYYDFALNVNATVSDNVRVNVQLYSNSFLSEDDVSVDFAFAEYSISDQLKVRAGKVKHPFGIYGDVKRVGVIRPFFTLPTSTYDHEYFVSSGFKGVSLLGDIEFSDSMMLSYELYKGKSDGFIYVFDEVTSSLILDGYMDAPDNPESVSASIKSDLRADGLMGGKLTLETPINGLSLMGSYTQATYTLLTPLLGTVFELVSDVTASAASFNYEADRILLRGEYTFSVFEGFDSEYRVAYIEAGYHLTEELQAVFRWEDTQGTLTSDDYEFIAVYNAFPGVLQNDELAFGLNYKLSPAFVIRASLHSTKGILWATPEDQLGGFVNNTIDEATTNVIIGVNYSF